MHEPHFEFFPTQIGGKPASIFVDTGWQETPAVKMHVITVRLPLAAPTPAGLSTRQEFDELVAVEQRLSDAAEQTKAYFVGRVTCSGWRDFFFYSPTVDETCNDFRASLQHHEAYECQINYREDSEWSVYKELLLPTPRDWQLISNSHLILTLKQANDDLKATREVTHWAHFSQRAHAEAFANAAVERGFTIKDVCETEEPKDDLSTRVTMTRKHTIEFAEINTVTLALFDAAAAHEGRYDGWETPVVAKDKP